MKDGKPNPHLRMELIGEKVEERKRFPWQTFAGLATILGTLTWKLLWPRLELTVEIPFAFTQSRATDIKEKSPAMTTPATKKLPKTAPSAESQTDPEPEQKLLQEQEKFEHALKSYLEELGLESQLTPTEREELEIRRLGQSAHRLLHDLPSWMAECGHPFPPEWESRRQALLESWQTLQSRLAQFGQTQ